MLQLELTRRQVIQGHVRPYGVVVPTPSLDDDAGFTARSEPLQVQALVPEAPVKRFVGSVLPRLAWVDMGRVHVALVEPFEDRRADKFRTIVRSQMGRRSVRTHQLSQNVFRWTS